MRAWVVVRLRPAVARFLPSVLTRAESDAMVDRIVVGFEEHGLQEIVSFTVPKNLPSRRVMERLGMRLDREFEHPSLAEGHALRRHVLYRLSRERYRELSQTTQ